MLLFLTLQFGFLNSSHAQFDSLLHNNITRTYLTHLPSGYTGTTPLPLVIAMHGGFGSATNLQDQSQLSVKADAEHFIVVYPEGVKNILGIRTWNAGWCCGYASTNNIDDVGFINVLIDSMISQYNIDTTRIYATGMSNGGFMSYRLACELSNRIAAIAPVAATMSLASCNPLRPLPVIQFHSYLDTNVPYMGGVGNGVSSHWNSPQDSVHNVWSALNGCLITNDTINNDSLFTHVQWSDCNCSNTIQFYITHDGGHSWPGGNITAVGDPPSAIISANNLMWDFFQQHTLACDSATGIYMHSGAMEKLEVFPNPSAGVFMINSTVSFKFDILDLLGKPLLSGTVQSAHNKSIDLTFVPDGVYQMVLQFSDNRMQFLKLVKISM